jgi:hypothetical protein
MKGVRKGERKVVAKTIEGRGKWRVVRRTLQQIGVIRKWEGVSRHRTENEVRKVNMEVGKL